MQSINEPSTRTKNYFYQISRLVYLMGAPNLWYGDLNLPTMVYKIHDKLSIIIDILIFLQILSQFAALHTQQNLSKKQSSDLMLFCVNQPLFYSYMLSMRYYKDQVRIVFVDLAITLKEVYNDVTIETHMLKKSNFLSVVLPLIMCSLLFLYGVDAMTQVIAKSGTFTTMVTAWPEVHDTSAAAGVMRVLIYMLWWCYLFRSLATYIVIIPTSICLSHQYKQLQSYFRNLIKIFETDNLSQDEKEKKYEQEFKIGIKLHSDTLSCTTTCQTFCSVAYGVAIIVNIIALALVMTQMLNSERTMTNTMSTLVTGAYLLITTACFMWTAGDITYEASLITNAIYSSGWHLCRKGASARIRPLLVVAMARGQMPVEMRCLGIVTLSYESYVTIVKSSYSLFSILY